MGKRYKHYFKVKNHELFGGEGTEGYMSLAFSDKKDNPVAVALELGMDDNVEYIEISEEEYLNAME